MDRRTWLTRAGATLLGVACAPLAKLADWHAATAAPFHSPILGFPRGSVLFVNSAVRGRGGPGTSWETAFASLQDALDTTGSPGTTILIASNHVEHLTVPIIVPEHGARVIGLSDGSKRPSFRFNDTSSRD